MQMHAPVMHPVHFLRTWQLVTSLRPRMIIQALATELDVSDAFGQMQRGGFNSSQAQVGDLFGCKYLKISYMKVYCGLQNIISQVIFQNAYSHLKCQSFYNSAWQKQHLECNFVYFNNSNNGFRIPLRQKHASQSGIQDKGSFCHSCLLTKQLPTSLVHKQPSPTKKKKSPRPELLIEMQQLSLRIMNSYLIKNFGRELIVEFAIWKVNFEAIESSKFLNYRML